MKTVSQLADEGQEIDQKRIEPDEAEPHYIIAKITLETKAYLYPFNVVIHSYRTVAIIWCPTRFHANYQNQRLTSGGLSAAPQVYSSYIACKVDAEDTNAFWMDEYLSRPTFDAKAIAWSTT